MPASTLERSSQQRRKKLATVQALLAAVRVEGNAGRSAAAARLARRALRLLDKFPEETELHALLLINLAAFESFLGHGDEALVLLDQAVDIDRNHTPAAYSTKGMILERSRSYSAALEAFDVALGFRPAPDDRILCTTYLRRGLTNNALGRLEDATHDFSAAEELSESKDLAVLLFMSRHNLGCARFLRGDLPGALAAMEAAQQVDADKPHGEPALDRARVLLAAGLLREAREFADRALEEFSVEHMPTELAEALLVVSELSLLSGSPESAEKFAATAVTVSGTASAAQSGPGLEAGDASRTECPAVGGERSPRRSG